MDCAVFLDAINSGRTDVQKVGMGMYAVPYDVVNEYLLQSCAQCGKRLEPKQVLTCSQCGDLKYCSKPCQLESWKSIHKLYCKRHKNTSIGKLCWQNLNSGKATFPQLTVTLREHPGLGQLLETAMGQVMLSHQQIVLQTATLNDLKSMARVTSRRLSRKDLSQDNIVANASGLLTIAAAISTLATEQVDDALASTPLFRCVAQFFLHYAPKLAQNHRGGDDMYAVDIPLLSATVNLVHPKAYAPYDLMVRVVDATWEAIEACLVTLSEEEQAAQNATDTYTNQAGEEEAKGETTEEQVEQAGEGEAKEEAKATSAKSRTNNKKKKGKNKKKKKGGGEKKGGQVAAPEEKKSTHNHVKDSILPNLRMLVRNLAYIRICPSDAVMERIQRIVVADFMFGMDNFDHNAIQIWATTAQNMVEKGETRGTMSCTIEPNEDDDIDAKLEELGNALYSIIQVCAKPRLGGVDIVFRNEEPPPDGPGYEYTTRDAL